MAERPEKVRLVFDASFASELKRSHAAADAHPIRPGEHPIDWLRRVIDAMYWKPEGWDD